MAVWVSRKNMMEGNSADVDPVGVFKHLLFFKILLDFRTVLCGCGVIGKFCVELNHYCYFFHLFIIPLITVLFFASFVFVFVFILMLV